MSEPQELGELEELTGEQLSRKTLESFMQGGFIRRIRQSLLQSPTPTVLLDRQLHLMWVNQAFQHSFWVSPEVLGTNLVQLFDENFDDEKKRDLYREVRSSEKGYTWYGRVQRREKKQLTIIANLLILPLFPEETGKEAPFGYQGIFDDISNEYRKMLKTTYQSLLEAARLKDNDTGNHIERVNQYCQLITKTLQDHPDFSEVDREYVSNISYLAGMHDVGKIGTPDDILNKEGPLEPWEWEIMKEHTINGAYIMASYPNPMGKEIALRHHERWDGSGYPHGVSGSLIPLCGRIVSLADVYDALRMRRSYKKPLPHETAMEIVKQGSGSQFDPTLVEQFMSLEGDISRIYQALADPEEDKEVKE